MTFIPDPTVLNCGDVVYLKKSVTVRNYGRFTKNHEFRVKGVPLRENDTSVSLRDDDGRTVTVSRYAVTKVRP